MPNVDPLQELRDAFDQIAKTIEEPVNDVFGLAVPLVAGFCFEYATTYGFALHRDRKYQIAALRASGDAAARVYDFLLTANDYSGGKPEDLLTGVLEEETIRYYADILGVHAQDGESILTAMHSYIRRLTNIYDDTYLYE